MQVKAYDKKLNIERTMPEKAYLILQKRYDFISYVDEEGSLIDGQPQLKTQKKSVQPVVKPAAVKTPEDIAAKKAELEAMNQRAIEAAQEKLEESNTEPEVKVRKKPGPKPKTNA